MAHTAANSYSNPIIIEIFNGDLDISELALGKTRAPIHVRLITFYSAAAADVFALQNKLGVTGEVQVCLAQTVNGGMVQVDFGPGGFIFQDGLVFDNDQVQNGLSANDRAVIYLK